MDSWSMGSDVYLEFKVKVGNRQAHISGIKGELYRGDEYVRDFAATSLDNGKVSGLIQGDTFHSIGDYKAKFEVSIQGMGKHEYAIPFLITKSVLGKKRINANQLG